MKKRSADKRRSVCGELFVLLFPYPYHLPPRPANYLLNANYFDFYAGKTPQFSSVVSLLASVGTPRRISFGRNDYLRTFTDGKISLG